MRAGIKKIRMTEQRPFLGIVLVARQLSTQARTIFQYPSGTSGVCPDSLFGIGCTEFGKFAMPAQWLMNRKLEFEIEVCGPSIAARMNRCDTSRPEYDHLRFVSFPCDCVGAPLKDDKISAMTAFNIVFVFQSLRISDEEAELYWQALATISRAIIAEELRAGYLSLQVHHIVHGAEEKSSLVSMLKSVYHGLCSADRGVSLYVNDTILTHITVNPFSGAPQPPSVHQALLLTCNPDGLQAALPVDSASNVRRVIDGADPAKTIKEHMVELGLPISTIQRISQHLVYWKRAQIIPPLNKKSVLVINHHTEGGVQLLRSVHSQLNTQFNLKHDAAYYNIIYLFSLGKKLAEVKELVIEQVPSMQNRFNELCVFFLSRGILTYAMPFFRYFPPSGTGPRIVAKKPRPKFQNQLPHEVRCQYSPLEFDVIFERLRNNSTGSELMIKLISNYVKKHQDIMTARVELNEQFRCTNDDFYNFTEALCEGYLDSLLVKYECDQ